MFRDSSVATRTAVMLVAAFAVLAIATGAAAAADTTAESDWADDGSTVVAEFNASDEETSTIEFSTNTDDDTESIELTVSDGNETYADWTDLDDEYDLVEEDDEGEDIHAFDVDHDALEAVPGDAGEENTVEVTILHEYEDADEEIVEDETTFDVSFDFVDDRAVVTVTEDALDDDDVGIDAESDEVSATSGFLSLETLTTGFGILGDADNESVHFYETDDVGIADDNTTVEVHDLTTDGPDAFDDAADETDDGDVILDASAGVDGLPVFLFDGEADDDLVDEDDDTYAVYDGGVTYVELGADDYDGDDEEVDLSLETVDMLDEDAPYDAADVSDLVVGELSMSELRSAFGTLDVITTLDGVFWPYELSDVPLLGLAFVGAAPAAKRRATA